MKTEFAERTILFDGVCNLCCAFLIIVHNNDKYNYFKFRWIQSEPEKADFLPEDDSLRKFETIIYIENGKRYNRSTAFLKIARLLRFPWPLFMIGYIIPPAIRDWLYDRVAKNRYRIFGRKEQCMVPTGDLAKKFH